MTRPADPAVEAVVAGYQNAVALVRSQMAAFTAAMWGGLTSYRDSDISGLVSGLVPVVRGAKDHTATLTDAYLAALASKALDREFAPVGIPASTVDEVALRGVDDTTVYTRAGVTVWTALSEGQGIDDAAKLGGLRLAAMVATDLQLALTHSARYSMAKSRHVVGYKRVTDGSCCGLCQLAADRMYHKGDLMPIHPHCSCSVEPVFQVGSAVQVPIALPIGSSSGGDDAGDTPAVHLHGEIGPVLAVRGQSFTGPNDI